jgi:hypothetical protein
VLRSVVDAFVDPFFVRFTVRITVPAMLAPLITGADRHQGPDVKNATSGSSHQQVGNKLINTLAEPWQRVVYVTGAKRSLSGGRGA